VRHPFPIPTMNVPTPALRALGLAAALGVAYACRPVTLCGCPPVQPLPSVTGQVVSTSGASVHGVEVSAAAYRSGCGVGNPFGQVYRGPVGNDGRFSLPFPVPPQGDAETFCLRVAASPPGTEAVARDTVLRFAEFHMIPGVDVELVVP
jgi:hypothetical protein